MIALRVQDPAASHTGHSWHPDLRKDLNPDFDSRSGSTRYLVFVSDAFAVHNQDLVMFSCANKQKEGRRSRAFLLFYQVRLFTDSVLSIPGPAV